ncbi:Flp pilus assembly protein CpaB [Sulfitobacter sp. D35]|uniref:Flp pilus assembly protein CpaB n=1 Tax=Sulfitobacter sp. D35 TaxID=3083252 RepID=UPI00296FCCB2|nr:Flp pilus assembly protein CpaB [Sulfitobacter sp. D35]MDW4499484.1 Flp pilus assembly protein CpaB [Sulfitobacter sp. D35]
MRMIFGLVLLFGVALAGGAVYMAKNYIGAYQAELARERAAREQVVPTVTVFVADRALKYGEELTREDVREVNWPETAIPEGAFTEMDTLFPPNNPAPRLIVRDMEASEAVLAVKVTEPGQDAGLTSRLERGMRAFTIKVDVASGVSGFLRPGDKVDVYWTGQIGSNDGRKEVTKLIEAAVRLIAIDQSAVSLGEATIARTVTVSVSPEQVAALAQAQATGNLTLSLVGTGDDTIASAIEVDQRTLLGIVEEEVIVQAQEEKVCTIRTRRGAEVMEIPIPCTN